LWHVRLPVTFPLAGSSRRGDSGQPPAYTATQALADRGRSLLLTDLSPNVGLWWYLFTEMFDHFRPFFLSMFSVSSPFYIQDEC
jgi:hypothetical protein